MTTPKKLSEKKLLGMTVRGTHQTVEERPHPTQQSSHRTAARQPRGLLQVTWLRCERADMDADYFTSTRDFPR